MAHRNTLKKQKKSFKTRYSTKGSIKTANKGRIDNESGGVKKHVMSKAERRNFANQVKLTKQAQLAERTKIFDGCNGVPRNVAIVPLTPDIDSIAVAQKLSFALDAVEEGMGILRIPCFRQKMRLFVPQFDNFFELLDTARSADFVLFVLSATKEITDYGEQIMRCITLQGVSTSFGLVWNLDEATTANNLKETDVRDSLTSWFHHFFPEERLFSLDNESETTIAGRLVCQKAPKGLHWRDDRAYIVLEKAQVQGSTMIVEGAVRGKKLCADQLMHVPTYGDFRIARVEVVTRAEPEVLEPATVQSLDRLLPASEAVELRDYSDDERLEGSGVRIDGQTDIGMLEANIEDKGITQARHVPKGTSSYQAAWFIEGEDYRSDVEEDDDGILTDEEGELAPATTVAEDIEVDGEDEEDEEDMAAEVDYDPRTLQREAKYDLEFPDEIELDPRSRAKDRLKRYRGVHSIRHTEWDALENDPRAPDEFTRLYRPGNLFATKNRITKTLSEGMAPGTKVRVYLEGTTSTNTSDPSTLINRGASLTAFALLPGEEKYGYVNATITMDSEVTEPTKSKQQLMVQYGPRRLVINPIFSQGGHADNGVYKYHRFLHPGRSAVVSFIAPVMLNNAPVVYYRMAFQNEQILLGSGSVQDSDANRVIVKTAILTGLPVKIHRKLVTIRHMFFSREDVEWFRAVPLFTKLGAQGHIKECLGTHGLFKATFDRKIRSEDTVAMALYKRQWPLPSMPASM